MKSEKNEKGKIQFHLGKPELKGNAAKEDRKGERREKTDTVKKEEEGRKKEERREKIQAQKK
jgi:hypothetical protein